MDILRIWHEMNLTIKKTYQDLFFTKLSLLKNYCSLRMK